MSVVRRYTVLRGQALPVPFLLRRIVGEMEGGRAAPSVAQPGLESLSIELSLQVVFGATDVQPVAVV